MILFSFLAFTLFAAFLTFLITRRDEKGSSDGFFLGGRSLTFPVIAGSLLLTNLSTEQMVGLNGAAYKDGLAVMAWEVVAVISLVLMAAFFLPRFLKAGITTVPQFLENRFDRPTQTLTNMIFLLAYAFLLIPIILYSGAVGLSQMLDLKNLTGITEPINFLGNTVQPDTAILWGTVFLIGIMGSLYSRFGGLKTLAVLDTINGVGLLVGGFMIAWFALNRVSDGNGIVEGWKILKESNPEHLNSIGTPQTSVPFSTLFTGVALLNLFYWCTNQQIIQRTFGASSLAEGQKGVLLTGALKLLGPVYLVIPGIIAYHLFAKDGIGNDQAYGTLVREVLPPQLTGFFAAVMVGAILSSFNAALNSTSALFSIGLYHHVINPKGSERQMVRAAKIFVVCIAIAGMFTAPLLAGQSSRQVLGGAGQDLQPLCRRHGARLGIGLDRDKPTATPGQRRKEVAVSAADIENRVRGRCACQQALGVHQAAVVAKIGAFHQKAVHQTGRHVRHVRGAAGVVGGQVIRRQKCPFVRLVQGCAEGAGVTPDEGSGVHRCVLLDVDRHA